MDLSTSGCKISNPKPLTKIALLAWFQIGLGPGYCWIHQHGAVIDDITRI